MKEGFFQLAQVEQQRAQAGKSYLEFLHIPAMSAGVYTLPAGATDAQKPHKEDEMYYVVRGRARMRVGAEDRVLFGTGASVGHPQPIVEAIAALEMPHDLVEGYGYPELTPEIKAKLFSGNMAALHGLDVPELIERVRDDAWARRRQQAREEPERPWRALRERFAATTA